MRGTLRLVDAELELDMSDLPGDAVHVSAHRLLDGRQMVTVFFDTHGDRGTINGCEGAQVRLVMPRSIAESVARQVMDSASKRFGREKTAAATAVG